MTYRLFGEFAHRYDLHTPPTHYQHDHRYIIDLARRHGPHARLLDVGCGTGTLLVKAREAGLQAIGIDASPEMVAVCERKLGPGTARVQRMQDLDAKGAYDLLCALSWTLHYAENPAEVAAILARFHRALKPGGTMVLQLAHAANATGKIQIDREPGTDGTPDDVVFMYRFTPRNDPDATLLAEYVYLCWSSRELVHEDHTLVLADVPRIASIAVDAGFLDVRVMESWEGTPLQNAIAPILLATNPG